VTFVLPGFFSREKGQHRVVIAAFLARRSGADLRVRLVGRGGRPYTQTLLALRRILRQSDAVQVAPWTDDLDGEYARAHFVLSASRNEAFGRTVVEAFAHGRPVIGLSRGATALLLGAGGGILVAPATVRELGRVMAAAAALTQDEYMELARRAAERGDEYRQGPSQYEAFRAALVGASLLPSRG